MQVIGNPYRSKIAYGTSIQMVIPLQAYFGDNECSFLSYKKMVLLHQRHGLGQADNRAGKMKVQLMTENGAASL